MRLEDFLSKRKTLESALRRREPLERRKAALAGQRRAAPKSD
jgi:hypothetical protein